MTDSTVMNNVSQDEDRLKDEYGGRGGGIANLGGQVTLTRSVVAGNTANYGDTDASLGGGIYSSGGSVTLNESLIRGNYAGEGAGVYVGGGTALVTNSTVAENDGSGIANVVGTTTVRSSTIVGNQYEGVTHSPYYGGSLTISSTLIAQNDPQWGSDCYGSIASEGYKSMVLVRSCHFQGSFATFCRN